jgi:DNA repair protein RecO
MKEYLTDALVLGLRNYRENDKLVDLYSKDFGRLKMRVIGGRRILSKLSPHLDIFNLVTIRLVQKNRITLADVVTKNRFALWRGDLRKIALGLKLFFLVRSVVPEAIPDLSLWHHLLRDLKKGSIDFKGVLRLLGYDPRFAQCGNCFEKEIYSFDARNQIFLCQKCHFRFDNKNLIYLN